MKKECRFLPLDSEKWERREIFWYFSQMAPTGYSLTTKVDVSSMRRALKEKKMKFYPAYLWLTTKLMNEQTEFRIAVQDGKLGYFETLTPLYAVFHEDDHTFSLMWTAYDDAFPLFYEACLENEKKYGKNHGILAQKGMTPPPNAYTVSCLPWVDFSHFAVHTYENKSYFFPSLEAGKWREEGETLLMPLSITCHHAATDGYHVHRFLQRFQEEADHFADYMQADHL